MQLNHQIRDCGLVFLRFIFYSCAVNLFQPFNILWIILLRFFSFIKIFFSAVEMFNFRMRLFICQKNLIINTSKMCSSCSALQRGGQQFLYKYFLLSKNMLGNGENAYLSPDVYQSKKLPGSGNSLYI